MEYKSHMHMTTDSDIYEVVPRDQRVYGCSLTPFLVYIPPSHKNCYAC